MEVEGDQALLTARLCDDPQRDMLLNRDSHEGQTAPSFGWRSRFEQLERLRIWVEYLRTTHSPKLPSYKQFEYATFYITLYREMDWPEHLRQRVHNILKSRETVFTKYTYGSDFRFDLLTRKQRRSIADDIFALYEACLLDIGRIRGVGGPDEYDYQLAYPTQGAPFDPRRRG